MPLFGGCSRRELGERELPDGTTPIRERDRGHESSVVLAGEVKAARKRRRLNELGAGSWVGEIALVSNVPRTVP